MNIARTKVDFTCPDCHEVSQAAIGQLETGSYECPECGVRHFFDKAVATRIRDSIESNLTDMQAAFERMARRK